LYRCLRSRSLAIRSAASQANWTDGDYGYASFIQHEQSGNVIPAPFLAIMVLWLVHHIAGFGLFSALNMTVFTYLSLFALSASCAIFLILELSPPFSGLMTISSGPLRHALGTL